ncbi:MAG: valine--tRNA ligase [Tissierellia bacterium]|nr:valine--tRNA ligase [Tissierellia bacterium]
MKNLEKNYDPKQFEEKIYERWKDGGYFVADNTSDKKPYTIVMPPPNVTGQLHMGHALNNTIQDILIRHKRMAGYEALWVPGTDHASISTEAKVVEKIREEGKEKEDLGREKFLDEAWAWTDKYGGRIKHQLEMMGCSCDWSREAFTLDEHLSKAVEEVFLKMYDDGLIYRGDRIVNYCPSCHTAVSDAEVEHVDEQGHMWHIKYPFVDGEGYIEIATTRPETMLGDLAVAVNPEDERYRDIVGKKVLLPLVEREIPIIADEYVDMEFGTGMVKITPSHDPNDFEVGSRHDLGQCICIDTDGKISKDYGKYSGLDRYVARKEIVKDLEEQGYLLEVEDHDHAVGHCERCKTTIEPLISKQYFVKMEELARPALNAYKNGELKIIPERFGKVYANWLENIRDWCISRQLWWGHRIPMYYHKETGEAVASRENPDPEVYVQDEDTLDTWFSSALWPFSTLGWPEDTEDLEKFFPTNVLVTGYDIVFFWVIRMVFSSLYNMGELPFTDVFFNGIVRDDQGRKMSKSLGNGIDPIEIIDQYGADALRFTLVTGNSPGNDLRFYTERVEASRNFANKLWNATRFVFMNLDENLLKDLEELELTTEDRWIISRANRVSKEMVENLDRYEIGLAAEKIYNFIWSEFCDWYIEMVKPRLYQDDVDELARTQSTLVYVLNNILKMLHPFMPFITEEIYQIMPNKKDMLIVEQWPEYDEKLNFEEDEKKINLLIKAVSAIRNARAEMDISPKKKAELIFVTEDEKIQSALEELEDDFKTLASTKMIRFTDSFDEKDALVVVLDKLKIYIPLEGLVDYQKELDRLEEDLEETLFEIKRAKGKLSNKGFVDNAPEKLVKEEQEKLERYEKMEKEIRDSIEKTKDKIK